MRSMMHNDGRGASLSQNDRNAAASLYGSAAPAEGAPPSDGGGFAAPSGVSVAATSPNEAHVTWTDNSDGERRFRVQVQVRRRFVDVGMVGANMTEMVVGSLTPGSTVAFRVRAERRGELTAWSEVATATLP